MPPQHQKGLILVVISALLFSTPGLFTRGVSAGAWDVTFWRAVFGTIFAMAYLSWRGTVQQELGKIGRHGVLASVVWASGAIAYIQAYKLTSIANVSLIYGSAPLLCALVAWIALGERPRRIVLAGSVFAFVGVAVVGYGSFGGRNFLGDILAVWMTFTVAVQFAIFRKHPETSAIGTTVLSSLLCLPPCLVFGAPFTVSLPEIMVLAGFGLVLVLAATLLMEGSKFLPAGETALVSNLEVPVQPVLAYLVFAELPPAATFIGGALIIAAVLVTQWPAGKVYRQAKEPMEKQS
jgi:drug/metabolite transporter (DMT)-like permease